MRTNMIVSCSFYLVSSAGMSVFNKLAILALPLPITLVIIQMVFTCASIGASWRSVHIGSRRDALRWGLSVPLLFSAMLVSSMVAMEHNTLGTVVVFRNVAPLFTLLIERMFRVPMQVSRSTVSSLLLIVAGVVMYNWNSIALSRVGLAAIVCNMVFAVLERLLQRHLMAQEPVDISKPGMMLLNNSCGLVPNMMLLLIYQARAPHARTHARARHATRPSASGALPHSRAFAPRAPALPSCGTRCHALRRVPRAAHTSGARWCGAGVAAMGRGLRRAEQSGLDDDRALVRQRPRHLVRRAARAAARHGDHLHGAHQRQQGTRAAAAAATAATAAHESTAASPALYSRSLPTQPPFRRVRLCHRRGQILVIMFGVLVLNDAVTPLAALGVVVAMVGGLWYAQERKRLSEAPRPRPAEVQDEKGALLSMEEGKASCGPTRASPSPRPAPCRGPLITGVHRPAGLEGDEEVARRSMKRRARRDPMPHLSTHNASRMLHRF